MLPVRISAVLFTVCKRNFNHRASKGRLMFIFLGLRKMMMMMMLMVTEMILGQGEGRRKSKIIRLVVLFLHV